MSQSEKSKEQARLLYRHTIAMRASALEKAEHDLGRVLTDIEKKIFQVGFNAGASVGIEKITEWITGSKKEG